MIPSPSRSEYSGRSLPSPSSFSGSFSSLQETRSARHTKSGVRDTSHLTMFLLTALLLAALLVGRPRHDHDDVELVECNLVVAEDHELEVEELVVRRRGHHAAEVERELDDLAVVLGHEV